MEKLINAAWILLNAFGFKKLKDYHLPVHAERTENFFRATLDNLLEGCQILGFDWKYIYLNNAANVHNRRPMEELLGRRYMDLWPGIEYTEVFMIIRHCLEKRIPRHFENEFIFPDGAVGWFDLSIQPIPEGVLILSVDITDRKRAEKDLKLTYSRLRRIVDSNIVGIVITTASGKVIDTNDYYLNVIGFSRIEFESGIIDWRNITPPEWITLDEKALMELKSSGTSSAYEKEYLRRDGIRVPVLIVNAILPGENEQIVSFVLDNTERKKLDEALRKSEDLFNKAFHGSPSPMTIASQSEGRYLAVNDSFLRLMEYSREEVIGKNGQDLNLVDATERHKIRKELFEKTALRNIEVLGRTKSGRSVYLLTSIENTQMAGEKCTLTTMLDITDRKSSELLLQDKNDEIEAQNEEYLQLNEELMQANEELHQAKERAEESDRLKTAFLQNMSHEIRTPMNAIMGFSDLLVENYNNRAKLEKFALVIHQRCADLLDIINGILDISKIETGQHPVFIEQCKLKPLFSEISLFFVEYQSRRGKQNIDFKIQIDENTAHPELFTDQIKLKQILINLISNAFKFTDKGAIKVGFKFEAEKVLFYVSDSGIGIPLEQQNIIFDRFTRLQPKSNHLYEGTGLGLSIVKGLVKLLEGEVWLRSEAGMGTTFYFTVPYKPNAYL